MHGAHLEAVDQPRSVVHAQAVARRDGGRGVLPRARLPLRRVRNCSAQPVREELATSAAGTWSKKTNKHTNIAVLKAGSRVRIGHANIAGLREGSGMLTSATRGSAPATAAPRTTQGAK